MLKMILDNPLRPKFQVRGKRTSQCLALVLQNREPISRLRDLDLPWCDIASHLGMSTGSLRQAVKQVNTLGPTDESDKPNALRPNLTLYFVNEADKQYFIKWVRAFQNGEELTDEDY